MKVLVIEPTIQGEPASDWRKIFSAPLQHHNSHSFPKVEHLSLARCFAEAAEMFECEHPDVVLIHFDKAGTESFDFCQNIRSREQDRHTGLIFVSYQQQGDDLLLKRVLDSGVDDFIDERVSDRQLLARIHAVYRFKVMADRLRSANHQLKIMSLTDELTGLSNMRSFNMDFQRLLKQCRRRASGLGVVMLDLDHFKSVNDNANHLVGSFVIGEIGRLMLHSGIL